MKLPLNSRLNPQIGMNKALKKNVKHVSMKHKSKIIFVIIIVHKTRLMLQFR